LPAEFYFQLLNPLIFLLFAAGLFAANSVRMAQSAKILGYSYLVGAAAFVADLMNKAFPPFLGIIPTTSLYALCAVLVSAGVSLRYRGSAPWTLLASVAGVHMAIYSYCHLATDNFWFRSIEANVGAGVIFAIGLANIRGRQQRRIDRLIFALYALSVVQCFVRPWLVVLLTGGQMTPETYSADLFLITMHLIVGVCAIVLGMALLIAYSVEMIEELRRRSETDPLSGLLNRRGFEEQAPLVFARAEQIGAPVGVIIADIDRFKSINDTHGHDFGDMVIAELGQILGVYADDGRIAGRIGGEEFALLLSGETGPEAAALAEAIREDFSRVSIETPEGAFSFTASFGTAERRWGEDLRYALAKADEALYLAKSGGRNRVCGEADVGVEKLKAARDKLERRRNRSELPAREAAPTPPPPMRARPGPASRLCRSRPHCYSAPWSSANRHRRAQSGPKNVPRPIRRRPRSARFPKSAA